MAGSLHWFVYTSDDAKEYAVQLDESNALVMGFEPLVADGSNAPDGALPKYLEMRYCTWRADDGSMSRKLHCPTNETARFLTGGAVSIATLNGNVAVVKTGKLYSAIGERRRLLTSTGAGTGALPDTGLTDP